MKKILMLSMIVFYTYNSKVNSQTTDDVLNLLIQRSLISQQDADSLRVDGAQKQQDANAKKKSFPVIAGKALQLGGYIQTRYQANDEPGKIDGFDLRRARFDVRSNISPYWGYRLQADFAGTSAKLIDAYAELKWNDYLNFTIGQTFIPFSFENLHSNTKLEFIDRSQVVEALVARGKDVIGNHNGLDLGIQVGGTLVKLAGKPLIDYKIGLFNGNGINTSDNNESKDVVSRILIHPVAGLDLGGSWYSGYYTFGTPAKSRARKRLGLELNYELNRFFVRGEFITGSDAATDREGYYAQAGFYLLPQKLQLLAKYDAYDPDKAKDENTSAWYILGVNYYFHPNVRIQANYTFKEEQGTSINNNLASVQFQVGI
jgi:hypothetical protein